MANRQPEQPAMRWDDSRMKTSRANACNVTRSGDEIILSFGKMQAPQPGAREVTMAVSDHLVVNPATARQLAALLAQVVREYEARHGQLPEASETRKG
jgi:hypothetical protein